MAAATIPFLPFLFFSIILVLVVIGRVAEAGGVMNQEVHHAGSDCGGSMADCFPDEELGMDSETNQRLQQSQQGHLIYSVLKHNYIPCGTAHAPYTKCGSPAQRQLYGKPRRPCSNLCERPMA